MPGRVFSVIIFCEHSAESLRMTLQGLGNMDYTKPFEVLVLDDGSRPGRESAVAELASSGLSVRYLSMPNTSRAFAWNAAIGESDGGLLAFLDDDCIPPPVWLNAFEPMFDEWTAGVIGGPDRVPKGASVFERSLDYVLTSLVGTLGIRNKPNAFSRYYPRPWNMAARKEAIRLAGGFDEHAVESPEVALISRLERMRYTAMYQPEAVVWHLRETNLLKFLRKDFRLGAERGRGMAAPGMKWVYGSAYVLAAIVIALSAWRPADGLMLLMSLSATYAEVLLFSGIHATIEADSMWALVTVPFMTFCHHIAHLLGYTTGCLSRRRRVSRPHEAARRPQPACPEFGRNVSQGTDAK